MRLRGRRRSWRWRLLGRTWLYRCGEMLLGPEADDMEVGFRVEAYWALQLEGLIGCTDANVVRLRFKVRGSVFAR